jgi:hypothetical protein
MTDRPAANPQDDHLVSVLLRLKPSGNSPGAMLDR